MTPFAFATGLLFLSGVAGAAIDNCSAAAKQMASDCGSNTTAHCAAGACQTSFNAAKSACSSNEGMISATNMMNMICLVLQDTCGAAMYNLGECSEANQTVLCGATCQPLACTFLTACPSTWNITDAVSALMGANGTQPHFASMRAEVAGNITSCSCSSGKGSTSTTMMSTTTMSTTTTTMTTVGPSIVTGSMTLAGITNTTAFVQDPQAKVAIAVGIANATGVATSQVNVTLSETTARRLEAARRLASAVLVSYVLTVPAASAATAAVSALTATTAQATLASSIKTSLATTNVTGAANLTVAALPAPTKTTPTAAPPKSTASSAVALVPYLGLLSAAASVAV